MGTLIHTQTGRLHQLMRHQILGRSSTAGLRLQEGRVSGRHASLRWDGCSWQLRDLHSKNGTFVAQRQLPAGATVVLDIGAEIALGSSNNVFVLTDASPPALCAMLISHDRGRTLPLDSGLCVLPSAQAPLVTIYRDEYGEWWQESVASPIATPLPEGEQIEVGGEVFVFTKSFVGPETSATEGHDSRFLVKTLRLLFRVPENEECVRLEVASGSRTFDLGSKSAYYLLLTLARVRLGILSARVRAAAEDGWVFVDSLEKMLDTSKEQINVDVCRVRQAFRDLGVDDSAAIIERQRHLIRIGAVAISVQKS
jgi:hypothetical protein